MSFYVEYGKSKSDLNSRAIESRIERLKIRRQHQVRLAVMTQAGHSSDSKLFQLNQAGRIIPQTPHRQNDSGDSIFYFWVPITQPRPSADILATSWPQNTVFIANRYDSGVAVNCFSLVFQGSKAFAVVEETQRFAACESDGRAIFPGCQWKKFRERILLPFFADSAAYAKPLPPFSDHQEPSFDRSSLEKGQAWVEWYNICRGYGAVILRDGRRARVHWRNIEAIDRRQLVRLESGDIIGYKGIAKPNVTNTNGTKFEWEIYGASLVAISETAQIA